MPRTSKCLLDGGFHVVGRFRLGDFLHLIFVLLHMGAPLEMQDWKQWLQLFNTLPMSHRCFVSVEFIVPPDAPCLGAVWTSLHVPMRHSWTDAHHTCDLLA